MDAVDELIVFALREDIGAGDITTDPLVPAGKKGSGQIKAKQALVLAGLDIAERVFRKLEPDARLVSDHHDGDRIDAGQIIARVEGRLRTLLRGERTALNFLQRLCGIATWVDTHMAMLKDSKVQLVDTRKTTPGWRVLEKYAVRVGGARNHRMGLFDGVLIKDNHIAACGSIAEAVARVRASVSHLVKIEVEVTSLAETEQALSAGAEVIMLDNMDLEQIRAAVDLIAGRAMVEVSGSVRRADLPALADCGVDIISMGALTHSAQAVDISMDIRAR